ncbi:uncharacterized protein LOC129725084 [Wyeomyia smithii]|uniref:uncharacterized protein LOC129725084 n=1 Tax=Wyeomyia smithii TaxID=174621 RepID=UPI002467EF50|nr:uncharacterized protein LOC129725084 [Wyeomyia smithii]
MFTVVQFIHKQRLNILTVPVCWVKGDLLKLPDSFDDVVEKMRVQGNSYEGPARMIPAIVGQQFTSFGEAEAAAATTVLLSDRILFDTSVMEQDSTDDMLFELASNLPPIPDSALKLEMGEAFPFDEEPIEDDMAKESLAEYSAVLTREDLRKELRDLKDDLSSLIHTAVRTAVEDCFQAKMDSLVTPSKRKAEKVSIKKLEIDMPLETRKPIDTEEELSQWNTELADEHFCEQYLKYFSKIITPNSCVGNGDNACYTIVDFLFTRSFWNLFTWTGVNRGQKSQRGFREFGNVIQLLVKIVCIGDPTYDPHKLEMFCKTRLFRYSKMRASAKKVRRSACRQRKT